LECILKLADPLFDQVHTGKYRLSILLRPDGFSFSVLDTRTHTFIALSNYGLTSGSSAAPGNYKLCESLKEVYNNDEWLQLPYLRVDIAYASPKVTLIPQGFVHEESIENYFRFNHQLDAAEIIAAQYSEVGEMQLVYAVPACLQNLCASKFGILQPASTAGILIDSLLKANDHILARQVFLHLMGSYFDIIIIQGRKLLYFNTFRQSSPEDLVYFTIYVLEQLGFVPAEEIVTLLGDIESGDPGFQLLYQYIDRLSFVNNGSIADFSPVFSEVPVHKYYTLFNLPFCE
jgi:hypothetical protein